MSTEQITFQSRTLDAQESTILSVIRLSERPLSFEDVLRISRMTQRRVIHYLERLMKNEEIDQVVGGFVATDKGRYQTVLTGR